jgi:hypothetical protein
MRFEITVNGVHKCIVGVPDFGVLSAIMTRVKRNPARANLNKFKNSTREEFLREKVELEVGGLDSSSNDHDGDHFNYLREELKPGDEVLNRGLVISPG